MGAPANQNLFTDIDRAKDLVDAKTAELDERVLKPATNAYRQAASDYPLATVFLTILAILSFFPIAAFVGFTICAGSLIIASVLLFSIFWLGVIIGGAAFVLCSVLSFAVGLSIIGTVGVAAGIAVKRAIYHIRDAGSLKEGIKAWAFEIKDYIARIAQMWSGKRNSHETAFGSYGSYNSLDGTRTSASHPNGFPYKAESPMQ